ncbi:MAG: putative lipoprotein [Spirochaetia bacterium]|nr:putative lipoprotein [Spirochaetia bacterium]
MKKIFALFLISAATLFVGCAAFESVSQSANSISRGLGSISDSVWSISTSLSNSSNSSSGGAAKARLAYMRDVRNLTAVYCVKDGGADAFTADLGQVAERHGISDWAANESTYLGIGKGLRQAGVDRDALNRFQSGLGNSRSAAARLIAIGYES